VTRADIIGGGWKNGMPVRDRRWALTEKKERTWLLVVMSLLYIDNALPQNGGAFGETITYSM
jgi:hypothetical protein